jgi:hypothetical protein
MVTTKVICERPSYVSKTAPLLETFDTRNIIGDMSHTSGKLVSKQKAARASHGVVNAAAMECRIFGLVMGPEVLLEILWSLE